jgi:hypothetical protein
MFLIFHVEAVGLYNTAFVGMCMIYQCAKFYMPNRNTSLFIAVKPKAKCRYYAAATMLTCTLQGHGNLNLHVFVLLFTVTNFRALQ